jgi:DNA-directed RNA polymerase beta subunit
MQRLLNKVDKPTISMPNSGEKTLLYPNQARKNNYTYSANLIADFKIILKILFDDGSIVYREEDGTNFHIASIPILTGCDFCNTKGLTKNQLLNIKEDPNDVKANVIVKGNEWTIDLIENMSFNKLHCYKNAGYADEVCRGDFISKPGDDYEHSTEHIFVLNTVGAINIKFNYPNFKDYFIPFYVYCRLLVEASDKEIMDNVVGEYNTEIGVDIANLVSIAMRKDIKKDTKQEEFLSLRSRDEICDKLIEKFYSNDDRRDGYERHSKYAEQDKQVARNQLMSKLDKAFMPHVGRTDKSRHAKFRFVCELVRNLLLVNIGAVSSTKRDHYGNKRLSAAGNSYSKIFKRRFNKSVRKPVIKAMDQVISEMGYKDIPLVQTFKGAINNSLLQQELIQVITSASLDDKMSIPGQKSKQRLSTQLMYRKNELNQLSILRTIRSPNSNNNNSKADKRADMMRRVQPSYWRYVCPIQSADTGMMVGITKQLAITAEVTESSSGELLKGKLMEDDELVHWLTTDVRTFYSKKLHKVFVNGELVGGVLNPYTFVRKWQIYRRNFAKRMIVHPKTTIHVDYETGDVRFSTDMGRITAYALVVINNHRDFDEYPGEFAERYDEKEGMNFEQKLLLKKEQVNQLWRGKITIMDLHKSGAIEYISAEEIEIALLSVNLETLNKNKNNPTLQYTHCEIPQAIIGLVAHVTPFGEHNQLVRNTYNTNQTKQAGGEYVGNWYARIDKQRFLQYVCETPALTTLVNRYTKPNGCNIMFALSSQAMNQEDSLVGNESSWRTGLFTGAYITYVAGELDSGEKFGIPDATKTLAKKRANSSKIDGYVVKPGTILQKDDVVICKYMKFDKIVGKGYRYQDRSIIWEYDEPARVEKVVEAYNQDGKQFIKVKVSIELPVQKGDKFSSRLGQKGVESSSYLRVDFMYDENGLSPDLVMNPSSIPTRMTIGQVMEVPVATAAAMEGVNYDGTVFCKKDLNEVGNLLEEYGVNRFCYSTMYNGMTGRVLSGNKIFFGVLFYQRLQKFSKDEKKAKGRTRKSIETRQPSDGLRSGEMEQWTYIAHSATLFLMAKNLDDSDGFILHVCGNCHHEGLVSKHRGMYTCSSCTSPDIFKVKIPYANVLFYNELNACMIGMRIQTSPYVINKYR